MGTTALIGGNSSGVTAIGADAGRYTLDGTTPATNVTNGVYIGQSAKTKDATVVNEIVIGRNAFGNGSNTTTIGNQATISTHIPSELIVLGDVDIGANRLKTISNLFIGGNSGLAHAQGFNNTFVGWDAGRFLADGTTLLTQSFECLYFGAGTRGSANGVSRETVIGRGAIGNGTNTITIGSTQDTDTYLHGNVRADQFTLYQLNTPPASSSAPGDEGQILIDENSIYICTAANTWKKVDLTTF